MTVRQLVAALEDVPGDYVVTAVMLPDERCGGHRPVAGIDSVEVERQSAHSPEGFELRAVRINTVAIRGSDLLELFAASGYVRRE